ncbi:DNA polymerase eta [Diachasma alloeum]|uniref:DNA polymerase eta n=1 Tax=Diachasma alloeum TaxID=454923 RepID=UPI0007381BEA|nr:DNA polymerase eta [Diachasma alloeum]
MWSPEDRIIVLIDMDCFFCQVESRDQPHLKGQPLVVSQNNVVLAVSYEARALGVTRFLRSEDAKEKCPSVAIVNSPISHGKSDNTKYRAAGQEVLQVLRQRCPTIERASIDEAYLDITNLVEERLESTATSSRDLEAPLANTFVVGYSGASNDESARSEGLQRWLEEVFDDPSDDQSRRLATAAVIVEELRGEILQKCSFTCSAGISCNKVLAKLACGLHKPNKQTILTSAEVPELFSSIPVNRVRNLGGKIGKTLMENLGCRVMSDLLGLSLEQLARTFDERTAKWLFGVARGVDQEPVTPRLICKSIAASKNFFGRAAIVDLEGLRGWVGELAGDLEERLQQDLEDNRRRATTLTVCYHYLKEERTVSQAKSCAMGAYRRERIAETAFGVINRGAQMPIVFISLGATRFVGVQKTAGFAEYFRREGERKSGEMIGGEGGGERIEGISEISLGEEEEGSGGDGESLVKLKEIFPDLDDMDHSVLELLPIELQDEAKVFMEGRNKGGEGKSRGSGGKSPGMKNAGVGKRGNSIQDFFVKSSGSGDDSSKIRCGECGLMIQGEKYSEHCDFHVAQNLQKRINRDLGDSVKRIKEKSSSPEGSKKTRSIDSYFGKLKN